MNLDLLTPEIALGVAAALATLVVYDVFYIWPIHRRISRLHERCEAVEKALGAAHNELVAQLAAADQRTRDEVRRLGERIGQLELATEQRSYEQAIGCAERGEEAARLISCFGLTEGEANLVTLLHGDPARRAEFAKVSPVQVDTPPH